ncbi:MAG: DUF2478 domain-containing protein [Bacteroidetes bacterium]|nr:DUF2478 domain-containing protein [Bacteroidota bacterium]
MILIAVTGPVASGKSSFLLETARWALASGLKTDGFIAVAGYRESAGQGASSYDLFRIGQNDYLPFAVRDPGQSPPYRFNAETIETQVSWADSLADRKPELIILDEFGNLELQGKGHFPVWEKIRDLDPPVVIMAVSERASGQIEEKLGVTFDLRISPQIPDAGEKIRQVLNHHQDWTTVGTWGSLSGAIESTVGAALHTAQIPFRGHLLSTTQSVVLMKAGERLSVRSRVAWISFISAILKSFSPSGQRLRPMIAISVQGLLFSLGVTLTGWNLAGLFTGAFLIGSWAALQGILLQLLLVGTDLLTAIDKSVIWISDQLGLTSHPGVFGILAVWVIFSGLMTGSITLWLWIRPQTGLVRLMRKLEKFRIPGKNRPGEPVSRPAWLQVLSELARPAFWAPVLIIAVILFLFDSDWGKLTGTLVRAFVAGLVIFSLFRLVKPLRFLSWLEKKGHWGPVIAVNKALKDRKR